MLLEFEFDFDFALVNLAGQQAVDCWCCAWCAIQVRCTLVRKHMERFECVPTVGSASCLTFYNDRTSKYADINNYC